MAVFRVTSRTENRQAAKASVRYIENAHRREEDKNAPPRYLFGRDGERQTRYQAYRMIDKAPWGTTIFRIALSPDKMLEDINKDLNLQELTETTMMHLQSIFPKHAIPFVAAIHTNTDDRHVHILALLPATRIPKTEPVRLIEIATNEAQRQRAELDKSIARTSPQPDISQNRLTSKAALEKTVMRQAPSLVFRRSQQSQPKVDRVMSLKPWRQTPQGLPAMSRKTRTLTYETAAMYADPKARTCPNCGPNHEMERFGRRYECPSCGLRLRGSGLSLEIISRPGLELELEGGSAI